ncbi:MAG: hypothetical protein R3E64_09470 [Halioglobus sp.]
MEIIEAIESDVQQLIDIFPTPLMQSKWLLRHPLRGLTEPVDGRA